MKILKFIISILILIFFSSLIYSYILPDTYGQALNNKRINLNLSLIDNNWQLDSIWSDQKDFNKSGKINKIKYFFNFKNKVYYQEWSNSNDTVFIKEEKEIAFLKSILFWENKILSEGHSYYIPISKNQYQNLYTYYDFDKRNRDCSIDTLNTLYKIEQEKKHSDSLHKLGYWKCGIGLVNNIDDFSVDSLPCEKAINIINKWKQKQTTHNTIYSK